MLRYKSLRNPKTIYSFTPRSLKCVHLLSLRTFQTIRAHPSSTVNNSYQSCIPISRRPSFYSTKSNSVDPDGENSQKPTVIEAKKPLVTRITNELKHYWVGTKLLYAEIAISAKLLLKLAKGMELTWREKKQLKRTTSDLLRLIPFAVIIIVPFMELLLPVILKFFPNMLPSTYETTSNKDEKKRKLLKVRLEVAKFLQQSIEEMATLSKNPVAAKEFLQVIQRIQVTGENVPADVVLKAAKAFGDELTLENLSRPQLVSMCRYMNIPLFGTDNLLRTLLYLKIEELREEDKIINNEGIDSLSVTELQNACMSRGIRVSSMSIYKMKKELSQWLELSLVDEIPPSILILSRAFSFRSGYTEETKDHDQPEAIVQEIAATINSLPPITVENATIGLMETSGTVDNKKKLDALKKEEMLIKEELKQEEVSKAEPANVESTGDAVMNGFKGTAKDEIVVLSWSQLVELGNILLKKLSLEEEKRVLEELQKTNSDPSKPLQSGAILILERNLENMLKKLTKEMESMNETSEKHHLIELTDPDSKVSTAVLAESLKEIKTAPLTDEKITLLLQQLDKDKSGNVRIRDLL